MWINRLQYDYRSTCPSMFTAKLTFSQQVKRGDLVDRSPAIRITNIYKTVSLNMIQKQRKYVRKINFMLKNETEAKCLSRPKSVGILTALRCISGPNLAILAWAGDKLSRGQAQSDVKFYFQVKFDLEGQGPSTPKTKGILTVLRYICCPNLVMLTWACDKLSCGQAQNEVKCDFQFDLEGQGRLTLKSTGILTNVFCTSGQNLVILAWTADDLSCGQASYWYTHTDTQTQAMTIPEGQNWPRVKRCDRRMDGRTDRRTDGQTDGRTERSVLRAAWSQLKIQLLDWNYWILVVCKCFQ